MAFNSTVKRATLTHGLVILQQGKTSTSTVKPCPIIVNYYNAVGHFGGYVNGALCLYDPKCEPLPSGIKEKAANAFRINGKEQE